VARLTAARISATTGCDDKKANQRIFGMKTTRHPPIRIGGKMTFMKKVWADESVRGVVSTAAV